MTPQETVAENLLRIQLSFIQKIFKNKRTGERMSGPLSGMRVIEGSAFVAAPSGGMTLAQLGAEVIRFDPIGGGLDYKRWPLTDDGSPYTGPDLIREKIDSGRISDLKKGKSFLKELIGASGEDSGYFLTNFPPRAGCLMRSLRGVKISSC